MGAEEQVGPIVSGGARVLQSVGELTAFPAAQGEDVEKENPSEGWNQRREWVG